MIPRDPEDREHTAARAAFVHRELVQLVVLIAVAVSAFVATRAVAVDNSRTKLEDAAEWYRRGQQALVEGDVDRAIDAFRRATVRNRTNPAYTLAFARALASHHDHDEARSVLLTLRESTPEDAEVNLELARLAGRRNNVTEAVRFYHSALYAPWLPDRAAARRDVRFELIRFLLAHGQSNRALSELLALASDTPDDSPADLRLAHLFAEAGDDALALLQFERALRLAPTDPEALVGAGLAAFRLGQYSLARAYLGRAPADAADVVEARQVVELLFSTDPLAARIGSAERRRRLVSNLEYVRQRLAACLMHEARATRDDEGLVTKVDDFVKELQRARVVDQDTVESGVALVDRISRRVSQSCSARTPRDRALALVRRRHGGDSQ